MFIYSSFSRSDYDNSLPTLNSNLIFQDTMDMYDR